MIIIGRNPIRPPLGAEGSPDGAIARMYVKFISAMFEVGKM